MPLTPKGKEILSSMLKTYGNKKKAESVLYASINSGKITGAEGKKRKHSTLSRILKHK
jgi:hypothetical protein